MGGYLLQVIQPDSQREAFSNPLPGNGLPRAGRAEDTAGGQEADRDRTRADHRDGQFSLEAVNCLGVCAIGPVVVVDGKTHGRDDGGQSPADDRKDEPKENGGRA